MNQSRIPTRAALYVLVLGLVCMFSWSEAPAHQGILERDDTTGFKDAIELPKPAVSYAVYASLERTGDVDFISFTLTEPQHVKLGILLPYADKFKDYYPVYALVGPGLAAPDEDLPFELPEGYGILTVRSTPVKERPEFLEPFSFTRYYRGIKELELDVKEPGTYYVVVWHPDGEYGDYLVSYGGSESFTFQEFIDTYRVVWEVKTGEWGHRRGRPSAK